MIRLTHYREPPRTLDISALSSADADKLASGTIRLTGRNVCTERHLPLKSLKLEASLPISLPLSLRPPPILVRPTVPALVACAHTGRVETVGGLVDLNCSLRRRAIGDCG